MNSAEASPSKAFLRFVDKHASRIPSSADRIRFLRSAMSRYQPESKWVSWLPGGMWRYSVVGNPPRELCVRQFHRGAALALAVVLATGMTPLHSSRTQASDALGLSKLSPADAGASSKPAPAPNVWLLETTGGVEVYSNGLQVDARAAVDTKPRAYRAFDVNSLAISRIQHEPRGIVFHTTESQIAPFDSGHTATLKRNRDGTLAYVRKKKLYHYMIDRGGRVFRTVNESHYANHAGKSIWADQKFVYLNLNPSFLGVSFEAETASPTRRDRTREPFRPSEAQVHAARVLVEMLRWRYQIPAENCVTHAQVAINAQSMQIGRHMDWASDFPFRELGLGNQYATPVAAISLFGFRYDPAFLRVLDGKVWPGLIRAESQLLEASGRRAITTDAYRRLLQTRYRDAARALARSASEDPQTDPETLNEETTDDE